MIDQTINITLHTLNKYGVPCEDVTDYEGESSGSNGDSFYLQKNGYSYMVRTKIKGAALTGIAGYLYCYFYNDEDEEGVSKGYCSYYSLHNGQLVQTVELPFRIDTSGIDPMVDIDSDIVVYSAVEFEGDVAKYNRFQRDDQKNISLVGRVNLDTLYYQYSSVLYLKSTDEVELPSFDLTSANFDPATDTITYDNHGLSSDNSDWVSFITTGIMPGGLAVRTWYVVVNATQNTFQLARNPFEQSPWTGTPIDITSQGVGIFFLSQSFGNLAFNNVPLSDDITSIYPSNHKSGWIHVNSGRVGRLYYEQYPDLSAESDYKRIALGKYELFVGDLAPGTDYITQIPFSDMLPTDYPDRETYTMLIDVFNEDFDDGSGNYVIGSGNLASRLYNNNSVRLICASFDDIRGESGNQMYQKWFSSTGYLLYTWQPPSYMVEDEEQLYTFYPRINQTLSFFYVAVHNQTGVAYLYRYDLTSGQLISHTELVNPTLSVDGLAYRLTNRQLIADRYLMLHTTSSYHVFFDAYNPGLGIQGQITMEGVDDAYGFFVIPGS